MANFNEKINCGTGHVLSDRDYFIYRSDSTRIFERLIDSDLLFRKNSYRLCIQYKDTHPIESIAGHCFRWECASNTMGSYDVRNLCLDSDGNEDLDNFGDPVFDSIEGAIFITDKYVVTYGDSLIEAGEIRGEHVVCNAYVCGRFVSKFRIPAEVFDRHFGLQENFPKQSKKNTETEIECVEVSFADSDEGETGNAQIVAENTQESTNEKESTELILTGNERITDKIVPESYWRELFGSVFFDKRKCQEDIEDVKLFINYAIGLLRGVLCRFDDTQESVENNAGLKDDGLDLLRHSKVEMDVVRGMLLEMINNVENVELRACKYRCTDAKDRDLQ